MPEPKKELTEKQKKFCEEYLLDWNGTRAYRAAYPDAKVQTAEVNASKLLRNTKVKAYLEEAKKDLARIAGISKLRVLKEYQKMAFSSIAEMHNTWVTRKEFEELTPEQKACISEIQTQTKVVRTEDGELDTQEFVKVKLYDKNRALEGLNKMLGYNEPEEQIQRFNLDNLSTEEKKILLELSRKIT